MDDQAGWEAEETGESAVKRLTAFFRSIVPVDPTQLLFLTGTILLLVTQRVSWRPNTLIQSRTVNYWEIYSYTGTGNLVVLAAGLMGLYACFWPLRNPVRKVFWTVLVTGLLGLLFLLWKFFDLTVGEPTVLDRHSRVYGIFSWIKLNLSNFPTGFYILALGLLLVSVYLSRMALRVGTLPLALSNVNSANGEEREVWPRDRLVLFALIGVFGLLANLPYFIATLIWKEPLTYVITKHTAYLIALVNALLNAGLLLGISLFIWGRRGLTVARLSLKLPELPIAALAVLLPAAAYALIPAGHFLLDRIHWATYEFGRFHPPIFSTYFDLRRFEQPSVVFLIFAAFAEEIIFRGILLQDFIRRYGLHRGIFLTGLGWAAIHFRSDSYTRQSVVEVFLSLLLRVTFCVGMNYVLSWSVLRWKSVVPAGITHTVWNMFALSGVSTPVEWQYYLDCGLWLVIAFLLFRFWPVVEEESAAGMEAPNLEPAV